MIPERFQPEKKFASRIRVLKPDGKTTAYYATAEQARKIIRDRRGEGLGNKRKFFAVRLFANPADCRDLQGFAIGQLRNVPVINPEELLAPSPRRYFGSRRSVDPGRSLRTNGERDFMRGK